MGTGALTLRTARHTANRMSAADPAVEAGHIAYERRGALGRVRLTRPDALNAVTHEMVRSLTRRLAGWAADDAVAAVAITGEGKAFSAGGDIRALYERMRAGDPPDDFFADEYALNVAIKRFPKPYVALVDGLAMGGGVGVSYHGSHVVVGEGALFAMPECGIGFFPDVGATHLLPRLSGRAGAYLGLTGARLGPRGQVAVGLARCHVPAARHDAILDALAAGEPVDDVLNGEAAEAPGETNLPSAVTLLGSGSIDADMDRIDEATEDPDTAEGARALAVALGGKCPVSLAVAARQIAIGADRGFEACMGIEARIVHRMLRRPDFAEGIRAAVIDKDREPRWSLAALGEVDEATVVAHFAPVEDGPLAALSELAA